MAQYALALYRDDDALKYAAAAVELQPDDPDGHKKLAEMYRSQQDFVRAIKEFKLAIQHNPKLWPAYFELAELLLAQGQEVEADGLYRRVMRGAGDDDLVGSAIRLSAAINQKRGTLEVLETELLPIALGSPQKVVYRRLLVEVYDNLTAPLIQKMRLGGADGDAARARLVKIGARGVQPMIDALGDADVAQQQIAIELLGRVENKSAALPLFAYAIGRTADDRAAHDPKLAARAMLACGALGDVPLLAKFDAYLFPKSGLVPHDEVAIGAAYGVARIVEEAFRGKTKDKHADEAAALAQRLVETAEPVRAEMRIYAAIGLGRTHDGKHAAALHKLLEGSTAGTAGRAAALWALAELGDEATRATILGQAETATDPSMREVATVALARQLVADATKPARAKEPISPTDPRLRTLAEAALDASPTIRRAGTIALAVVATRSWRDPWTVLPIPSEMPTAQSALLPLTPTGFGSGDFSVALVAFERPITSAARSALETSKERAAVLLDAMMVRAAGPSFGLFTDGAATSDGARAVAARIADATEELVAALVHHPDRALQAHAIRWLGQRDTKAARAALVDAVGDLEPATQRLALESLEARGDAATLPAIGKVLSEHKDWSMRAAAARAIGAIGARDRAADVSALLAKAARDDASAFVREEALAALSAARGDAAKATLERAAKDDVEPRVRARAQKLLGATHG
jgi:HEAT repeat protein